MNDLKVNIHEDFQLPAPPAIAIQILDAVKEQNAIPQSLSRVISSDPALAARILKIANSSLFGNMAKIHTIDRAIAMMGVEALKNIALSFVIANTSRGAQSNGFDFNLFWKRSLTSAVSSNLLADMLGLNKDNTFVAGLLKDIGMLFMYLAHPGTYLTVFREKMSSRLTLVEAERTVFGFDHQEMGAAILEHWSFPGQVFRPIRFHHRSRQAPVSIQKESLLLEAADKIVSAYHGCNTIDRIGEIHRLFHSRKSITAEEIIAFIDRVGQQSIEILSSFEIDTGDMKPYSQMLREANEELRKLNLSKGQLILGLKQTKKKSDRLAKELKKANDQLRAAALRDGLTSLYNHAYFQDILPTEISRARRYNRMLSLIILDIDHFKTVNDTYGYIIGDRVLQKIARQARKSIRRADIASRCGGEKFAFILPETNLKDAVCMAERLRNDIEELRLSSDRGIDFGVTVSAGVATFDPSQGNTMSAVELIEKADRGLYLSKKLGRNRVSVIKEAVDHLPAPEHG
jgi:diguanylate cyclase (GGDEF)-like protein